ncbi:hypothetical protein K435DRAFT_781595 [Dendrothele bispora CBS 962.96]|uniref:intramembrane prenyl-peptidase Rce1 n=1 Tax=Dendrothele bispora (strain CBS 962.96) TaxID=1314807 RepID=A0A4S8LJU0_DENBC|nr:hypothetical protein K435DRAFT_781595 [Dendrothele bispora CBS 962.96]
MSLLPTSAHLFGLTFAGIYVGSLYVSQYGRLVFSSSSTSPKREEGEKDKGRVPPQYQKGRDDPTVIRARLTAASFATFACLFLACAIVAHVTHGSVTTDSLNASIKDASSLLGLSFPPLHLSSLFPHLVIPTLFLGPLTAVLINYLPSITLDSTKFEFSFFLPSLFPNDDDDNNNGSLSSLIVLRNYIVAPITEELVFRSCILSIYLLAFPSSSSSLTPTKIILLSPLHFGLAHLHHAWETYNRFGRTKTALKRAVLQSTFQMAYTTLFGALCAFLWLRGIPDTTTNSNLDTTPSTPPTTRTYTVYPSRLPSVYAPITAHIFCNFMGFPDFSGDVERGQKRWGVAGAWLVRLAYLSGVARFGLAVWTQEGRAGW